MKHWRHFLLLLVILCGSTFTAFWFYQANRSEKNLKESLASGPGGTKITYESISKSGFPFAITLSIKNPKLASSSILFAPFAAGCDGSIVLTYNLLGQLATVEEAPMSRLFASSLGQELQIDGKWRIDISSERLPEDTLKCTLDNFKLSERDAGGLTSISQIESLQLVLKKKMPEYDRQILDLDFSLKGMEYFVKSNLANLQTKDDFLASLASLLYRKEGKINYSFGLELDLPSDQILNQISESPLILLREPLPHFGVSLRNLTAEDNFTSSKANCKISFGEEAASTVRLEVLLEAIWKYSPSFYSALISLLDAVNHEAASIPIAGQDAALQELITKRIDDLKAAVPHFQDFGTIVSKLDTTAAFNKSLFQGAVNLKEFSLLCDLYGVRLQAGATNEGGAYSAECTVEILKAQKLLDDIVGYYNRVYKIANVLKTADAAELFQLTQPSADKIMNFLQAISTPSADKSNLSIHIAWHNGEMTVGNMSAADFRTATSTLWNELLQEVAPSLVPKEPVQTEQQITK